MPKNVLFSLKNCENRQALPLDSGGWGLRPQTPTPVILHYKFCSLHMSTCSDSFGIDQKAWNVLGIIAGVHQAFDVKKLCCIFYA